MQYILTVRVPVLDDSYDEFRNLFKYTSYRQNFRHSVAHPHGVELLLGPYTDLGVTNSKAKIDKVFSKYKEEWKKPKYEVSEYEIPGYELD